MVAKTLNLREEQGYWNGIREAASILDAGGLVVIPTETVYGVAARADRPEAVRRLRQAKRRSADKPFTIHIGRRSEVDRYVTDLSTLARRFMKKGWPGPLTLVISTKDPHKSPIASEVDSEGLRAIFHEDTVGLRFPDHRIAIDLLNETRGPVVAASANRAGLPAARDAESAVQSLDGLVDLALDHGPARYNRPSTIVRVNGQQYERLREGVYDDRMLRGFAVVTILFVCTGNTCRSPMAQAIAEVLMAKRQGCKPAELADRGVEIISAGTSAGWGGRAAEHAIEAMANRGIDIASHEAQTLTIEMIHRADHIYTMTESHKKAVLVMVPSAENRTVSLLQDRDITDPIGGSREVYAQCADTIEKALEHRATEIQL